MTTTGKTIQRRQFLALAGAAPLGAMIPAPALALGASPVTGLAGNAFGTSWQITLPDGTDSELLRAPVTALLARIDRQMSPWRADSDITRFNLSAPGTCSVPAETALVANAALQLAETSLGHFDPTVGPLVARWGFGPIAGDLQPDWPDLKVEGDTVIKARDGLTLDLCGIAKGYALDRVAALLQTMDYEHFLIDLGGELKARGNHPSGRPWQVGIEDPSPGSSGIVEVLNLDGMSVATSGDRENGYSIGGHRYSHIIDPMTGVPVQGDIASVTVLAPDAMTADGWATALMAAGAEKGAGLARDLHLPALFLLRGVEGLSRITTGAFDAWLA